MRLWPPAITRASKSSLPKQADRFAPGWRVHDSATTRGLTRSLPQMSPSAGREKSGILRCLRHAPPTTRRHKSFAAKGREEKLKRTKCVSNTRFGLRGGLPSVGQSPRRATIGTLRPRTGSPPSAIAFSPARFTRETRRMDTKNLRCARNEIPPIQALFDGADRQTAEILLLSVVNVGVVRVGADCGSDVARGYKAETILLRHK